jgi:hypothetical protein
VTNAIMIDAAEREQQADPPHARRQTHQRVACDGSEVEAPSNVRVAADHVNVVEVPSVEHERLFCANDLHAARDGLRILHTILREWLRLLFRGRRRRAATRGPAWLPARRRGHALASTRGLTAESD